jgi:hypothetical protein
MAVPLKKKWLLIFLLFICIGLFISFMICRSTSKFHQPGHCYQKTNVGQKPQVQEEEVLTEEKLRPSQGQGMFVI